MVGGRLSLLAHCRTLGAHAVGHDSLASVMALQCILQERERHGFASLLYGVGFQNFAFLIDCAQQVIALAVDLHEHLIEVPAPLTEAFHSVCPLPTDVAGEQRADLSSALY